MQVPSLKRIATHSPSAGQCTLLARVSGPRIVRQARPCRRVTTISQWLAPIDRNVPARSLWHRHTLSTNGESERRWSSKTMNTPVAPHRLLSA